MGHEWWFCLAKRKSITTLEISIGDWFANGELTGHLFFPPVGSGWLINCWAPRESMMDRQNSGYFVSTATFLFALNDDRTINNQETYRVLILTLWNHYKSIHLLLIAGIVQSQLSSDVIIRARWSICLCCGLSICLLPTNSRLINDEIIHLPAKFIDLWNYHLMKRWSACAPTKPIHGNQQRPRRVPSRGRIYYSFISKRFFINYTWTWRRMEISR